MSDNSSRSSTLPFLSVDNVLSSEGYRRSAIADVAEIMIRFDSVSAKKDEAESLHMGLEYIATLEDPEAQEENQYTMKQRVISEGKAKLEAYDQRVG